MQTNRAGRQCCDTEGRRRLALLPGPRRPASDRRNRRTNTSDRGEPGQLGYQLRGHLSRYRRRPDREVPKKSARCVNVDARYLIPHSFGMLPIRVRSVALHMWAMLETMDRTIADIHPQRLSPKPTASRRWTARTLVRRRHALMALSEISCAAGDHQIFRQRPNPLRCPHSTTSRVRAHA